MSKQIFIHIIEKSRKKFLEKLSSHKNVTLHKILLKNKHNGGWNADFTKPVRSKMYGGLLSYTVEI